MREMAARLDASSMRFGIAVARFNERITEALLEGAVRELQRHGAQDSSITVARVAGAFEVPQALAMMLDEGVSASPAPDALIAIGALIRGETPHFDVLAFAVTLALEELAVSSGVPLGNGVLTCDTTEQALERSGGKAGNKGAESAIAAIEMASLRRRLGAS
jgi:6,7-dimethyl-8-ribityllumazine synthase